MSTAPIPGYTAADLEMLTPEEIDALRDDEGDEAQAEAQDDTTSTDDSAPAADEADDSAAPAAPINPPAAEDVPADEADQPNTTAYKAEAPADAAEQLAAQQAARNQAKADDRAALKKLHEGEIDFEEYEAIKDKAEADRDAADEAIASLKSAMNKAEISAEMAQQEAARAWGTEVATALKASKAEGFDYAANPALHKELNGLVRAFAMEATENGMSDEGLKASKWALAQAQVTMRARHPALYKPQAGAARASGQPRHTLTTLGNLPSADRALTENDTVNRLAHLEGDDHERAMGSMSQKEMDKLFQEIDR